MAVLLDTHILVWLMNGDARLKTFICQHIEKAAIDDEVLVSMISVWEIALLVSKKRLKLDRDVSDWISHIVHNTPIQIINLSVDIMISSTQLPEGFHADPADRLIVATARQLNAQLVTADGLIIQYAKQGHVNVIANI